MPVFDQVHITWIKKIHIIYTYKPKRFTERITLLYKKVDKSDATIHCPITCLLTIYKLLILKICDKIYNYITKNVPKQSFNSSILQPEQKGFRINQVDVKINLRYRQIHNDK